MYDLFFIVIGGLFEPLWVLSLERGGRQDTTRATYFWYLVAVAFMYCSLLFLSFGMRGMNVGVAYAIWTAVGSLVTIILGRVLLKETLSYGKIFAITLILIGISGLELFGGMV